MICIILFLGEGYLLLFVLDVKRVSVTRRHHLIVLFPFVLHDQFDLILKTEEE
jgi:hypothetical protein